MQEAPESDLYLLAQHGFTQNTLDNKDRTGIPSFQYSLAAAILIYYFYNALLYNLSGHAEYLIHNIPDYCPHDLPETFNHDHCPQGSIQ